MSLIKKLIFSCFHLLFLSIAVYTRAADTDDLLKTPKNANTVVRFQLKGHFSLKFFSNFNLLKVRYITELLVIIMCLIQLLQVAKEIYGQGMKEFYKNLVFIRLISR